MQYVTYIGTRVIIIISCKLSNHIIIAYRTRTDTSIITVYVVRIIQVYSRLYLKLVWGKSRSPAYLQKYICSYKCIIQLCKCIIVFYGSYSSLQYLLILTLFILLNAYTVVTHVIVIHSWKNFWCLTNIFIYS